MPLITSESSSEGHPDKVADRISDTVVDAFLAADPYSRVACETMVTTNRIILAGEVRGPEGVVEGLEEKIRAAVRDIGYAHEGFHWEMADFACHLHAQSADIARGVDASGNKDEGAGDQGIMFGYATNETPELMPATLQYSHNILKRLAIVRHSGEQSGLEPDAKSQVTLLYENSKPVRATSIVLSTQHKEGLSPGDVHKIVEPYVRQVLPDGFITEETEWHVNPTGNFVIGGPDGDAGLTGRRANEDAYGGVIPTGSSFSGKDPTKVDRSGAYICRYLAKNVVAAGLADRCTIQIAYALGVATPVSFMLNLANPQVDPAKLEKLLPQLVDGATPRAIRDRLRLNRPVFARTSAYGHFGREPDADGGFSWEKLDLVDSLTSAFRHGELGRAPKPQALSPTPVSATESDPDALVFSARCTLVTVELAKASLEFFTRLLREHILDVPIETNIREESDYVIRLVLKVPANSRHRVTDALSTYMGVVRGEVDIEAAYPDPLVALRMRLQQSQVFVMLQNKLDVLEVQRQVSSQEINHLEQRLAETKSALTLERRRLSQQLKESKAQVRQLTNDLSNYAGQAPEMVMAALRVAADMSRRSPEVEALLEFISEQRSTNDVVIVQQLDLISEIIKRKGYEQAEGARDLATAIKEVSGTQPVLARRVGAGLLNLGSGVAGNAVWAIIEAAMKSISTPNL